MLTDTRTDPVVAERAAIAGALEGVVADVARHVRPLALVAGDAGDATRALRGTERAARGAMGELRSLLHVLDAPPAERPSGAALRERRRVAREVHDLVGHGLSLVSLHAAVSVTRVESGAEDVGTAVERVRDLAAQTERELETLLTDLRGPREEPPLGADDVAGALGRLAADARRGGQPVELVVDADVPAPVARFVADVAREALTNARKHAGAAPVRLTLVHEGPVARLEVLNEPGAALAGAGSRFGLASLRARAAELGGRLDAGPVPGGGWRVTLELPAGVALAAA